MPSKKDYVVRVRCGKDTFVGFRRMAAEFDTQEHLLMWMIENFSMFRGLRSPELRKEIIKHGVI